MTIPALFRGGALAATFAVIAALPAAATTYAPDRYGWSSRDESAWSWSWPQDRSDTFDWHWKAAGFHGLGDALRQKDDDKIDMALDWLDGFAGWRVDRDDLSEILEKWIVAWCDFDAPKDGDHTTDPGNEPDNPAAVPLPAAGLLLIGALGGLGALRRRRG